MFYLCFGALFLWLPSLGVSAGLDVPQPCVGCSVRVENGWHLDQGWLKGPDDKVRFSSMDRSGDALGLDDVATEWARLAADLSVDGLELGERNARVLPMAMDERGLVLTYGLRGQQGLSWTRLIRRCDSTLTFDSAAQTDPEVALASVVRASAEVGWLDPGCSGRTAVNAVEVGVGTSLVAIADSHSDLDVEHAAVPKGRGLKIMGVLGALALLGFGFGWWVLPRRHAPGGRTEAVPVPPPGPKPMTWETLMGSGDNPRPATDASPLAVSEQVEPVPASMNERTEKDVVAAPMWEPKELEVAHLEAPSPVLHQALIVLDGVMTADHVPAALTEKGVAEARRFVPEALLEVLRIRDGGSWGRGRYRMAGQWPRECLDLQTLNTLLGSILDGRFAFGFGPVRGIRTAAERLPCE